MFKVPFTTQWLPYEWWCVGACGVCSSLCREVESSLTHPLLQYTVPLQIEGWVGLCVCVLGSRTAYAVRRRRDLPMRCYGTWLPWTTMFSVLSTLLSTYVGFIPSPSLNSLSVRCDMIRDAVLTCAQKPTQITLICHTEPTTKKWKTEKLKSKKRICSEVSVNCSTGRNTTTAVEYLFDLVVLCHLTAWLFCEGGGVRFIPAWLLYFFFVLRSAIFFHSLGIEYQCLK